MSDVLQLPDLSTPRARVAAGVRVQLALAGVSASKAARLIGVSQAAMSRRTTGEHPFDVDELGRLAEVLGIAIEDFFAVGPERTGPASAARAGTSVRPTGLEPMTSTV